MIWDTSWAGSPEPWNSHSARFSGSRRSPAPAFTSLAGEPRAATNHEVRTFEHRSANSALTGHFDCDGADSPVAQLLAIPELDPPTAMLSRPAQVAVSLEARGVLATSTER